MKLCWVPIFPDTEILTPEEKILGFTDGFFVFSCILVFTLHSAGHKLPESMCEHISHFQELHIAAPLETWYDVWNIWEVLTSSCILDKMKEKESHRVFLHYIC